MNTLNSLLVAIAVVLIMSFGTGLMLGGPDKARKIISWELRQLLKFGRWFLKHLFQTIANFFGYIAKQCGPKKESP